MTNKDKEILKRYRKLYPDLNDEELREVRLRFQNLVRIARNMYFRLYAEMEEENRNSERKHLFTQERKQVFPQPPRPKSRRRHSDSEVKEFVNAYKRRHGRGPTVRELQKLLGVKSTKTAWTYIRSQSHTR